MQLGDIGLVNEILLQLWHFHVFPFGYFLWHIFWAMIVCVAELLCQDITWSFFYGEMFV